MFEFNFLAFQEEDILIGVDSRSIRAGVTFQLPTEARSSFTVTDDENILSGDFGSNESATDTTGQDAVITVQRDTGTEVLNSEIYIEKTWTVEDENGVQFLLAEIEMTTGNAPGTGDDFFAFVGKAPPAGSTLTVVSGSNYRDDDIAYSHLTTAPPAADINLSELDANTGAKFYGALDNFRTGADIENIGDVNGDGVDDIAIRSSWPSSTEYVHIFYGNEGGLDAEYDLLSEKRGYHVSSRHGTGTQLAEVGDFNGDGFGDFLVGKWANGLYDTFLIYGYDADPNAELTTDFYDLNSITPDRGVRLTDSGSALPGYRAVAGLGDFNGDGLGDFFYKSGSGTDAYIVFGRTEPLPADFDVSTVDGSSGIRLTNYFDVVPSENDSPDTGIGDFNGDGLADLVISRAAQKDDVTDEFPVVAQIIYGTNSGQAEIDLGNLDPASGQNIVLSADEIAKSASSYSYMGKKTVNLGDINGDGLDDFAFNMLQGASVRDFVAVVYGNGSPDPAGLEIDKLDGSNGFYVRGVSFGQPVNEWTAFGSALAAAGDVNGDGIDDFIIGAWAAEENGANSGQAYVIYGDTNGFGTEFSVADLDGYNGFSISGVLRGDLAGTSVAGADLNGDGYSDAILGAVAVDALDRIDAGAAYVVYGGNFTGDVTHEGTAADDIIVGTTGADIINGAQGNDTITGGAGDDVLRGAAGADVFVFGPGSGSDNITDFGVGDRLDLSHYLFADFSQVQATIQEINGDVMLDLGNGDMITLNGIRPAELDASDVLL